MGMLGVITLPFRAGRLILVGRPKTKDKNKRQTRIEPLPVAGLSSDEHWDVLVRLQRLAVTPEEQEIVKLWHSVLLLSQEASSRLLRELYSTSTDLRFWRAQAKTLDREHAIDTAGEGSWGLLGVLASAPPVDFLTDWWRRINNNPDINDRAAVDEALVALCASRAALASALGSVNRHAADLLTPFQLASLAALLPTSPLRAGRPPALSGGLSGFPLSGVAEEPSREAESASAMGLSPHHPWEMPVSEEMRLLMTQTPSRGRARRVLDTALQARKDRGVGEDIPEALLEVLRTVQAVAKKLLEVLQRLDSAKKDFKEGDVTNSLVSVRPWYHTLELPEAYAVVNGNRLTTAQTREIVTQVEVALGLVPGAAADSEDLAHTGASYAAVLEGAHGTEPRSGPLASLLGRGSRDHTTARYPLGIVPIHARRPTDHYARILKRATAWTAVVAAAGYSVQLYRNGTLQKMAIQFVVSVKRMWNKHMVEPVSGIAKEAVDTLQSHHTVLDEATLRQSQASLEHMLANFARKAGKPLPAEGTITSPQRVYEGREILMEKYEDQVRRPIKNMVLGELPEALLIQVQDVKTQSQTALQTMDQLMAANQLTLAMVAALPALMVIAMVGTVVSKSFKSPTIRPSSLTLKLRMCLVEAERALLATGSGEDMEKLGYLLYQLNLLYRAGQHLFKINPYLHILPSGATEWSHLKADIMELASPRMPSERKRATAARMGRSYECLRPPAMH